MGCSGSTSGGKLAADKDTTDTWRSDEVPPGKEQPVDNPDRAEPYGDDDLALGVAVNWKEIADEVLKKGELYEDDEFPAIENSLFFSDESADGIVWKRPKEISDSPSLLVDGISRDDVVQGILGDCWFLSSCASIAQHKRFMEKVVPTDQYLWSSGKYCGLFHFRFWRFGKWVDVIIDDRIPVRRDQVIFAKSSNSKEFWVSLLEKAYAKLHGSYEGLAGGQASDALIDMTGGLTERCDLKEPRAGLFRQLLRNFKYGSFLTCNKKGDWRAADEADEHGLVSGHAYTVTSVRRVQTRHGDYVNLLRVRNPWGNATEWNGNWSDESATWDLVSDEVKGQLELKDKDDGEFWISYEDFCEHFNEVTICTVGPDFDGDGVADIVENQGEKYYLKTLRGAWIKGVNAGGCRNNIDKFVTNPQFVITLTEPDDWNPETDEIEEQGKCSIVVALMQEYRRKHKHLANKYHQIGFILYKTDNPNERLTKEHFMYNYATAKSGVYINYREVNKRLSLDPGHYVLIPSTFDPDCVASFLIRIFAEKRFDCKQI